MISVAIMAHRKREQWIPGLVASLDREPTVVWDQKDDRWDTGRRSLLAYDPDATHHLVVQDDAIVCRDLVAGLEQAVEHTGDHPLGLYIGMVRPSLATVARKVRDAQTFGARFVKMEGPWWGVGIAIPTGHIEQLVKWGDERGDIANYDKRISRWYRTVKGLDCWYPFPSLVEHRHGDENPSLVPGRNGTNRRAWQFIGRNRSALNIDWTYRPPEDGMATFRNLRSPHLEPVTTPEGSASFVRLSRLPAIWERVDTPTEPAPAVTVGDDDPDPSVSVDAFHTGAGWYQLPDGTKVRGKDAAVEALAAV